MAKNFLDIYVAPPGVQTKALYCLCPKEHLYQISSL